MKAREIREHIVSRAGWVDKAKTVDTFKHGEADVEVTSAAVTWMLTMDAIDEAERLGVNFVITHEPTFYSHHDDVELVKDDAVYHAKRKRLDEVGLTVLRIHDSWDPWPEIGIGATLASLLELTRLETGDRNRKIYGTKEPTSLDAFAAFVREKLGMDACPAGRTGLRRHRRPRLDAAVPAHEPRRCGRGRTVQLERRPLPPGQPVCARSHRSRGEREPGTPLPRTVCR